MSRKFLIGGEVCSLEFGEGPVSRPYIMTDNMGRVGEFIDESVKPMFSMPSQPFVAGMFAEVFGINLYVSFNSGACFTQFTGGKDSIVRVCSEGLLGDAAEKFADLYLTLPCNSIILSYDPRNGKLRLAEEY